MPLPPTGRFGRESRLTSSGSFRDVYAARVRRQVGPFTVWARPNELDHHRLGLAIGRRVGGAVQRNRLKRMLREAFRAGRAGWPGSYDLVVGARRHDALTAAQYRALLDQAVTELDRAWTKKRDRQSDPR